MGDSLRLETKCRLPPLLGLTDIVFLWLDCAPTLLSEWVVSLPGITTTYLACVGFRKDVCKPYVLGHSGATPGMAHIWDIGLSS